MSVRRLAFRCAAWGCVVLIAYLSLTPVQVRTPAPAGLEHAVAYAGTALIMLLAYPSRPVWTVSTLLAAYSGLLELLQNFSPGRHPGIDGVLWSSAGAIAGGLIAAVLRSRMSLEEWIDRLPHVTRRTR